MKNLNFIPSICLRKRFLGIAFFLFSSFFVVAQRGKDGAGNITVANTVVNIYTSLSANAAAGSNSIAVASAAGFSVGDLVFIIQMQGAKVNAGKDTIFPDFNNSIPNNSSYGAVTNYYTSGNNEFAQIYSISGTTFTLDCALQKSYQSLGKVQVIRVPRYTGLTISGAGSITCPSWNGTTGGVAVVEVDGATTLSAAGSFNVSAKGFRGGWRENNTTFGSGAWGSAKPTEAGYKGESIAGDTNVYKSLFSGVYGKGAVANGGGGGNAMNAGGGGGANGGVVASWTGNGNPAAGFATAWNLEGAGFATSTSSGGGRGGYTFSTNNSNVNTTAPGSGTWGGDNRRIQGGLGGRPLDYSTGRLFLGGGGGSGEENDNDAAPNNVASGGNGGGMVYILSYGNVSGAGTILADGGNGSNTRNDGTTCSGADGAGGGGGGGTVIINSTGSISLSAAIAVFARGGNGGNSTLYNNCNILIAEGNDGYGPGGGGGGGYVAITTGSAFSNVSGGTNGILSGNASNIASNFPPNGATAGGIGTSTTLTNFYLTIPPASICAGQSVTLTATLNGAVPTPTPSINWYSTSTGGVVIATGTTYTTGALSATTTYYVETCPGYSRVPVTVTVTGSLALPTVTTPVNLCQNESASTLSATAGAGNNLLWWGTNSSGGTSSATAPTPSTSTVGTFTYYVSQSNGSCESPRAPITVNVAAVPSTPSVNTPVSYCQNATASALSATAGSGNNLLWWGTNSTGGTSSSTATVPSTNTVGTFTYYVSQSNGTCESPRTSITVNVISAPAVPTVTSPINLCQNDPASTLSATAGTGNNLLWWGTSSTGGTSSGIAPTPSTATVGTFTYYVSQSNGTCESPRASISVNISTVPAVPLVTSPVNLCQNESPSSLSATAGAGNNLLWWGTNSTGGTSSSTAPAPSSSTVGIFTYYVSQSNGTCESPRAPITVNVNAIPNVPAVNTPVNLCQNDLASALSATSSSGNNLLWWGTNSTGGTSSGSAPIPSSSSVGTFTYYVSQSDGSCESPRAPITVNVSATPSTPLVTSPVNYCQNDPATSLSAVASSGSNLLWWGTSSSGGTSSATAPIPSTSNVGTLIYYVSQAIGSCESPRVSVTVTVNAIPSAPLVVSPVNFCQNDLTNPLSATASTGNTLLWWGTNSSGGTSSANAPTPSSSTAGIFTYYVSESNGTCESPRTAITVSVTPTPSAPLGLDTVYCQNQSVVSLTALGSGTLNWYAGATGGTASGTAPVPSTTSVGITEYYVSQTVQGCESLRDTITVQVVQGFSPPVASAVSYCQGASALPLSATATGTLNWYTASIGGTASATPPVPSTAVAGTTSYYVSAGSGNCESSRTQIDVVVNALPNSPTVNSPVTYCQNANASALSASGNGALNWYGQNSSGGTASSTAPVPVTTVSGTFYYFVSQTVNTCESERDSIQVVINALPIAPVATDVSYCQNSSANPLVASGTGTLLWYTAFPGTGTSTAPVPSTANSGAVEYYVTQTVNGCESAPDTLTVTISNSFSVPLVSNVSYCQNALATPLTATASGTLNWYTTASGGTATSGAPVPSTSTAGTTSYFVSQGSGQCESPRAQIDVTVIASPLPPVALDVQYCINESPTALNAIGSSLNWYSSLGGVGSTTAPVPSTNVLGTTNYFVSQTVNGCEGGIDTLTVVVIGLQPEPTATDVVYCQGDVASSLAASGTAVFNWWASAQGGTSTTVAPIPSTLVAGTFYFYVSQGTGACESLRDTLTVVINPTPSLLFSSSASTICSNECIQFTEISTAACQSISWNFGDGGTAVSSNPTHCYNTAGNFSVSATCVNTFGCSTTSTVANAITVQPGAIADFSILEGAVISSSSPVNFVADTVAQSGQTYLWNFGDPLSGNLNTSTLPLVNHTYSDTGLYCVRLIAYLPGGACSDTLTKCLEVIGESTIDIPNVFTPNGDGVNEVFSVKSYGITSLSANIFDRWGRKVAQWDGVSGFWDGKNTSGKVSSNGVYYYVIKAVNLKEESKEYSGFIQLITSE